MKDSAAVIANGYVKYTVDIENPNNDFLANFAITVVGEPHPAMIGP